MLFHETLKQCRISNNLTQKDVADSLGIHVTAYSHYEKGDRFPRKDTLDKLMAAYPSWGPALLSLPIETAMVFPTKLLDKLEKTIFDIGEISDTYGEAKEQYILLKSALNPVLKLKYEFLDLPDVPNIEKVPNGTITKNVFLDRRAEILINQAIRLQSSFWDKRFQ